MKKFLSLFLAFSLLILTGSVPAYAAGSGLKKVNASNISDYLIKESDGEYFITGNVSIEAGAFENTDAKAVCCTGEIINFPENTGLGDDAVVILNNSAKDSNGNDSKFGIAGTGCKWFAYDVLSFFGKTVLTFFYEPAFDADHSACFAMLKANEKPDYIYFESLNGKAGFYAKGDASPGDILNGSAKINPGFIVNILMNFYTGLLEPKNTFSKNPSLNAFAAIIRSLFAKKK